MKHTQKGAISDLWILILAIIILFFIWIMIGGKNNPKTTEGPFIVPLNDPYEPGKIYGY